MKKFLTVLLVIAVMFTFSFSTAFAAVSSTNASVIKSASAYAQSTVAGTIEKAFQTVLADKNNAVPYITEDAWEAALPTIVEAIQKAIQDEEATLLEKTDAEVESALALSSDMNITATALFPSLYMTYDKWAKELNNDGNKYAVIAAKAQFAIDYAEIVGVYDEIDVEALYSKTAGPDSTTTYYEMATDAIETSLKTLKGIFFTEKGEVAGDYTTVSAYAGWVNSVKGRVNGDIAATDITPVKAVNWDKTEVVKYYYLADKAIKTNEEVETVEATEAALKAAQKAQAAASYAAAIQAGVDKDDAAAALDAIYFLIDADVIKADEAIASGIVAGKVAAKYFDENLAEIEELEAYAEKAKAETDGEGNLVRNAEAVDAVVKAAKKVAYASFGTEYTNDADIKTIDLMNVSNDEAVLAFRKEVKKVALEDALEADLEKYYALEDTDVEAAYAVAIAAVAEMDSLKDFDTDYTKIKNTLDKALGKIKTSEDVDKLFETGDMATVITNQMSLFGTYNAYKNTAKTYEAGYVHTAAVKDTMIDYYIEAGARTAKEMKALTGVVEAVYASLPTTADLDAAAKAADEAIKAIPAKVTTADKAVVLEAVELVKAYNKLAAHSGLYADKSVATDVTALAKALTNEFQLAFAKATKTDEAAMEALAAEVAAANKELKVDTIKVVGLDKALEDIAKAEYNAVVAAINAIPFNVTAKDKEVVEAARALYEAYVAEYTNYEKDYVAALNTKDGFVADDFTVIADLLTAEAILGLNYDEEAEIIASVESLKLKASSTKGKGWIKVTWKVTGDTENVEGYQLYKSTKAHSGYKKCITTTKTSFKNTKNIKKGERYYYKVRAFVTVDGVKYYSDWSNKANRVAI